MRVRWIKSAEGKAGGEGLSIHLRIMLPLVLSLGIAAVAGWWTGVHLVSATLQDRLEAQLLRAGAVLADGGLPLTRKLIARLGRLIGGEIFLLGAGGTIGLTSNEMPDSALAGAVSRLHRAAPGGRRSVNVTAGGLPYAVVLAPLPAGRDPRFTAVAVAASLADLREATARAAAWLALIAALGMTVLAGLVHRVTSGISRPLDRLSRMARRIATGDRTVREQIDRPPEIRALASTLNEMVERLREYEAQASEQTRLAALGNLAGRVAHEVRNPLTAIKMQLQILGESVPDGERTLVADLLAEIRRLELLVAGIVEHARPAQFSLRPTDLNAVAREVGSLFKPQLAHNGIDLELQLTATPATLSLDPDGLRQILVNLLVNARDALPEGGTIIVLSCTRGSPPDSVMLRVADSGPGVSPQDAETLFASSISRKRDGLGLGLRLCKELAEAQKGTIRLISGPLPGACFEIEFPVPLAG